MSDYFDDLMEVILRAESLGSRTLSNRVRLIGHVPHEGPEGYLHEVFPALDDAQIALVEQDVGRPLPDELKEFYRHTNGLHLFSGALSIDGLRHSYVRMGDESRQPFSITTPNVRERPRDADDSFVFFGGYGFDASPLGMFPDSPVVYRCKRWTAVPINEWRSFEEMLISEVHRLDGLFDEKGRKIDPDAPTTPG